MLLLEQLYTDDDTNDDDDNDTNNDDNDTQWTNHDCIGSLACMPNEPKTRDLLVFKSCNRITTRVLLWSQMVGENLQQTINMIYFPT